MSIKKPIITIFLYVTSLLCSVIAIAGTVEQTVNGNVFSEKFVWEGNHAATILNGAATTVWWDESSWDVRGDTSFISVSPIDNVITNRFHMDIHKALVFAPTIGDLSNTDATIGGNGDAGVGVMHLDYQDILSARLRNPLLISKQTPGMIEFYASDFVTTGHWWEIALTPTDQVVSAEHTSVPGQADDGLPGPLGGTAQPGPGHSNPVDSINLISFGATDVPCATGWRTRFGLTKTFENITSHHVNVVASLQDLTLTNPADTDVLKHWRIQVTTGEISLFIDTNDNNQFELVESWQLSVPWSEVYVHLMAVAYQADHHPQAPCFLGHVSELKWRDIKIYPVKNTHTSIYPKNIGTEQVGRNEGWLSYDLRDIQRFGSAVNGAPQPNLFDFTTSNNGLYCNDSGFPCFNNTTDITLAFQIPTAPKGMIISEAKIIADLKNSFSTPQLPVSISLNGTNVGFFDTAESLLAVEENSWVRRSLALPIVGISTGTTANLGFVIGANSYLDRIEIEFSYLSDESFIDIIFKNGFEFKKSTLFKGIRTEK